MADRVLVAVDAAMAPWADTLLCPVGSVVVWFTASPPTGWLVLDGSTVSRTTYAALFALWGTTFGSGNGSTTFHLADMRGRFLLGKTASGTGSTLGGTGGALDHTHNVDPPATTSSTPSAVTSSISLLGLGSAAGPTSTHTVDIGAFNSGTANPPFLAGHFIVRAL